MTRAEKFLGLTLVLLLLASGVLLVALLSGRGGLSAPTNADAGGAAQSEPLDTTLSAREAYEVATVVATAWASDARLLSASGNWPVGEAFPADEAAWSLVFYSPARSETALIAVTAGQAQMVGTSATDRRPQLGDLASWRADSELVLERFMRAGGETFIEEHGEVSLSLSLDASDLFRWRAALLAPETNDVFIMHFDPASGTTLN